MLTSSRIMLTSSHIPSSIYADVLSIYADVLSKCAALFCFVLFFSCILFNINNINDRYGWNLTGDEPGWFPASHVTGFQYAESIEGANASVSGVAGAGAAGEDGDSNVDGDESEISEEQKEEAKQRKKRLNVAKELLSTEEGYVRDLHAIIDGYKKPCMERVQSMQGVDFTEQDVSVSTTQTPPAFYKNHYSTGILLCVRGYRWVVLLTPSVPSPRVGSLLNYCFLFFLGGC